MLHFNVAISHNKNSFVNGVLDSLAHWLELQKFYSYICCILAPIHLNCDMEVEVLRV